VWFDEKGRGLKALARCSADPKRPKNRHDGKTLSKCFGGPGQRISATRRKFYSIFCGTRRQSQFRRRGVRQFNARMGGGPGDARRLHAAGSRPRCTRKCRSKSSKRYGQNRPAARAGACEYRAGACGWIPKSSAKCRSRGKGIRRLEKGNLEMAGLGIQTNVQSPTQRPGKILFKS